MINPDFIAYRANVINIAKEGFKTLKEFLLTLFFADNIKSDWRLIQGSNL